MAGKKKPMTVYRLIRLLGGCLDAAKDYRKYGTDWKKAYQSIDQSIDFHGDLVWILELAGFRSRNWWGPSSIDTLRKWYPYTKVEAAVLRKLAKIQRKNRREPVSRRSRR